MPKYHAVTAVAPAATATESNSMNHVSGGENRLQAVSRTTPGTDDVIAGPQLSRNVLFREMPISRMKWTGKIVVETRIMGQAHAQAMPTSPSPSSRSAAIARKIEEIHMAKAVRPKTR